MSFILQPWQLFLVILAGWMNQLQQQIIDFQRKEIEVLKKKPNGQNTRPSRKCQTARHLQTERGASISAA
jgi:hypothetical protein